MARTDTLGNFLTDVANAIKEKKGTTDTIPASNFDTEIANLPSGGGDIEEYFSDTISNGETSSYGQYSGWVKTIKKFIEPLTVEGTSCQRMFYSYPLETTPELVDTSNVNDMSYMFSTSFYIKYPNLKNFNTSNVTNMSEMFSKSPNIQQLDLSSFNTEKVTNMSYMFSDLVKISQLDLSNFNTSNVTNLGYMFSGSSNIQQLDLSSFNTSNVTSMRNMFNNCQKLTELDLSNFDTSKVTNMNYMFYQCSSLNFLDIRNFDFTKVSSYTNMLINVPSSCEIIVKDETAKTWITSKFTTLTNVKTVAELEASS